jgi:Zn-finger nucleic acid-binding protein
MELQCCSRCRGNWLPEWEWAKMAMRTPALTERPQPHDPNGESPVEGGHERISPATGRSCSFAL